MLPYLSRRKILKTLAILALMPGLTFSEAQAWSRGKASGFNGGKSQVNLNFLSNAGDFAFLNMFKTVNNWANLNNAQSPITPDNLDVNGYPTTIVNSGVYAVFWVPTQSERPGNYVVTFTGNGTTFYGMTNTVLPTATFTGSVTSNVLAAGTPASNSIQKGMILSVGGIIGDQISGTTGGAGTYKVIGGSNAGSQSMTVSGGSKTGSGGNGRYVFSTSDYRFSLGISALSVTDLKCFHVDDEDDINAGLVFGKKFKQKLLEAKYGVIRFLNWQLGNTSNVTSWATRKPVSYAFYGAGELRNSVYGGVTTNTGNAYSVAAPTDWLGTVGGLPQDKQPITVTFNADATQSGGATLAVTGGSGGSTTDIPILNASAGALAGSTYPCGNTGAQGFSSIGTLVYDADLNAWIKTGGSSSFGPSGILNGVPPELMLQLCKEVGAHPYFITPALAADPATDYMPGLAAYCRDNAPAWMISRFEGPNELWNNSGGFIQTGYANAKVAAYIASAGWSGSSTYHDWYGKAMSVLGQACAAVFGLGNLGAAYQVVCGVQTGSGTSSGACASSNPRLASLQYIGQSTPAQSPYTKSAASGWVSTVCVANYVQPSVYKTATETTISNAFAGVRFTGAIVNGVLTVTAINTAGAALSIGQTLFGRGIANGALQSGVTITGGSAPTWTLSDSSINWPQANNPSPDYFYAASDMTQPAAFVDYLGGAASGGSNSNIAQFISNCGNWKTWMQGFGIQKMCCYEGDYSPDYTPTAGADPTLAVNVLRYASKLVVASPSSANGLQGYIATLYSGFVGLSGGGFVAEFPSNFQFSGPYPSNNVWSSSEDIYQPTATAPQVLAIAAFNA